MITYYQANLELGYVFGKRDYVPPSSYYIGVSQTPINQDGTGETEPPTESGYARLEVLNDADHFSVAVNGKLLNLKRMEFPKYLVDAGTVTYGFISDSLQGGHILFYEKLEKPRILQADSVLYFDPNNFSISLCNPQPEATKDEQTV